jgi:hypothetical protein
LGTKTIKINHDLISNPDTITKVNEQIFKDKGIDLHVNEVVDLKDDMVNGVRHLEVKVSKYFMVPDLPWKS